MSEKIDLENVDLKVHLAFDEDAGVWYVAASDIPGLRLEAGDPMELVRRIGESAAELMALNGHETEAAREGGQLKRIGFTPIFDSSFPVSAYA